MGNGDPNAPVDTSKEDSERAKRKAQELEDAIAYQKVIADEKNETIAARVEAYKKINELEAQQDIFRTRPDSKSGRSG